MDQRLQYLGCPTNKLMGICWNYIFIIISILFYLTGSFLSLLLGDGFVQCMSMHFLYLYNFFWLTLTLYTTKGRDWFHWAATPLKPYNVRNICHMTYRYSVLYCLNLFLKHFFPTENNNFCENIQIDISFRVLTRSRMPNRHTSQSKIEDIVHCYI